MKVDIRRVWIEFTWGRIVLGYRGDPYIKSVGVSFFPKWMRDTRDWAFYHNDMHSYCWGVIRWSNTCCPVCGVDEYEWGDLEF